MSSEADPDITGTDRSVRASRLEFEPLGEWVDHRKFCRHFYDGETRRWLYRMTRDVALYYPAYLLALRTMQGDKWRTELGKIEVDEGFVWNGPSWPAIKDETSVVGSLGHDICWTPTRTATGNWFPAGFFVSNKLYRWTNRAQGQHPVRAWTQWAVLTFLAWPVRLSKHPRNPGTQPQQPA